MAAPTKTAPNTNPTFTPRVSTAPFPKITPPLLVEFPAVSPPTVFTTTWVLVPCAAPPLFAEAIVVVAAGVVDRVKERVAVVLGVLEVVVEVVEAPGVVVVDVPGVVVLAPVVVLEPLGVVLEPGGGALLAASQTSPRCPMLEFSSAKSQPVPRHSYTASTNLLLLHRHFRSEAPHSPLLEALWLAQVAPHWGRAENWAETKLAAPRASKATSEVDLKSIIVEETVSF